MVLIVTAPSSNPLATPPDTQVRHRSYLPNHRRMNVRRARTTGNAAGAHDASSDRTTDLSKASASP
jgi:hypothetical protein